MGSTNSSARILWIDDARSGGVTLNGHHCYEFSYDFISRTDNGQDPIVHLTGIHNYLGTAETYYFYRLSGLALQSPFDNTGFGVNDILQAATGAADNLNPLSADAPNWQ